MNLNEKVPVRNWEKWLSRIVAIALAAYEAIKAIITAWS